MNRMNIVVAIGNSDNKLTQKEWADFVNEMRQAVTSCTRQIHFFGGSSNWEPWQTVAIIAEGDEDDIAELVDEITRVRKKYLQEAAGVMLGPMVFV